MIKLSNIDKRSVLRTITYPITFIGTASNFNLSDNHEAVMIVPFNCNLKEVLFANDVAITASNGIVLSICNATTDVIPIAAAGNGLFWSACNSTHLHTAADFPANTLYKIYPSASFLSAGSLLHMNISATVGTSPFAFSMVVEPTKDVK